MSAIVFGEGKWDVGSAENRRGQSENDKIESAANNGDHEPENGDEAGKVPFRHYGGSVRTVDCVDSGSIKIVEKRSAAKPKVMVWYAAAKWTTKRTMTTCKKSRTVMRT